MKKRKQEVCKRWQMEKAVNVLIGMSHTQCNNHDLEKVNLTGEISDQCKVVASIMSEQAGVDLDHTWRALQTITTLNPLEMEQVIFDLLAAVEKNKKGRSLERWKVVRRHVEQEK